MTGCATSTTRPRRVIVRVFPHRPRTRRTALLLLAAAIELESLTGRTP